MEHPRSLSTRRPAPDGARETLRRAVSTARGVTLLRGVLDDEVSRAVLDLAAALGADEPAAEAVCEGYTRAFQALAAVADDEPVRGLDDAWPAHLTACLLDDTSTWSVQAERWGPAGVARGVREQASRDLASLRLLCDLDAQTLWEQAREVVAREWPGLATASVPWLDLVSPCADDSGDEARSELRRRLVACADWPALAGELEQHWSVHGTGPVARYRMLRWAGAAGTWEGIAHPDPVRLCDLIGYEREQATLRANVERFLAGLPAQHALLYGPAGTGKSSTVKALANEYAGRGLRLLEVRKEELTDLPAIGALVRGRAPRFLVFVDDLSFEEHETGYKALKALLEGAAEARPANLLIHATTNRRNLVRESFAERGAPGDDVHGRDTMQEKISLVARFGLRVTFGMPDQERYVAIASGLAQRRGLAIAGEELRTRALAWERGHVGRSGRTARHFVDDLEAEIHQARE